MRLTGFEIRKLWRQIRWIWAVCLALKMALCILLPELKDTRIAMSRYQYDIYMGQFYGQATEEKESNITSEYERMRTNRETLGGMTDIGSEEYIRLSAQVQEDERKFEILGIFYEKVGQFAALREQMPDARPQFLYEYGWDTVFTYYAWPDVPLLVCVLAAAACSLCGEYAGGMMGLLRAAKFGRRPLWRAKTAALYVIVIATAAVHTAVEWTIFALRFSLTDGAAPLYSLNVFACVPKDVSSAAVAVAVSAMRVTGLLLLGLFTMALGFWLRHTPTTICIPAAYVMLSLLIRGEAWQCVAFPFTALLSGTEMWQAYGVTTAPMGALTVASAAGITTVICLIARHQFVVERIRRR